MSRFLAILTCLLVMLCGTACRDEKPKGPTEQEILDGLAWSAMSDIKSEVQRKTEKTDFETDTTSLARKIREAERLDDEEARNRLFGDLVGQLLYEKRFDEAVELAEKINDVPTRDRLLEDVVRFQVRGAVQLYQGLAHLSADGDMPKEVLVQLRQAVATARRIEDPLIFAESAGNIALFRSTMKDRAGAETTMQQAAETLPVRSGDPVRKARALLFLADWFLRQDDKDRVRELCRAASETLLGAAAGFEAASTALDVAMVCLLLGENGSAEKLCTRVEQWQKGIAEPVEKATILLRLADTLLPIRGKDIGTPLTERLSGIKALVLQADESLRSTDDAKDAVVNLKNRVLRKIAVLQAWGAPLEDVWDTVEEMDSGTDRDDAIAATVEMMIATQSTEHAADWAEEIADPVKKQAVLKKLKP